jgi:autotransporter-associated beta strand protein
MKKNTTMGKRMFTIVLTLGLEMAICYSAHAGSSYNYWTGDGDGESWSDFYNWDGLELPPNGIDAKADIDFSNVNGNVDVTLGHLSHDGFQGSEFSMYASKTFTLETSSGQPIITANGSYLVMQANTVINGTQGFDKRGDSQLFLYADSPYTGETVVSAGSISIGNYAGNALGASGTGNGTIISDGGYVYIGEYINTYENFTITGNGNGNGALQMASGINIFGAIGLIGDSTIYANGEYSVPFKSLGGDISLGSHKLTLNIHEADLEITGSISGNGELKITGTATVMLTASNTYTGGTTIEDGKLSVKKDASLGNISGGLTFDDGTLIVASTNYSSLTRSIVLNASGGEIDTNGGTLTVSTNISGVGNFTKDGPGAITFSGNNTYTGNTLVNEGTLQLTGDNSSMTGNITVSSAGILRAGVNNSLSSQTRITVESTGQFILEGDEEFGSLDGNGSVDTVGHGLDLGYDNTSSTFSGILSGGGYLQKNGSGTLTLANTNTYSGGTIINAGIIDVGTKSLGTGNVTVSGGTLSLGASPAQVEIGSNYIQQIGGTLAIKLGGLVAGDEYDQLIVAGQVQLSGILQVTLINDFNPSIGQSFDILDWGSLVAETAFDTLNLPALQDGLEWNKDSLYVDGTLLVSLPQAWLDRYGLLPSDSPEGDPDNDNCTTWQEYIADTNPTNAASFFHVGAVSNLPPTTIYFESSSNRIYIVDGCSNLEDNVWTNVPGTSPRIGIGGADSIAVTNNLPINFYKLNVQYPE